MTGRRTPPAASAPPSPPPAPRPTSSWPRNLARLVAEMRRQGTTTVEIKSGYGLTVARRGAQPGDRAPAHAGDHVPRVRTWCRPSTPTTPAAYVDLVTGPMLEACAPHARWVDVFCERGAFDADQARAMLAGRHRRKVSAAGCTPTSSARAPACSSACEVGLHARWTTAPTSPTRTSTRSRRLRYGGDPAARRGVLHPLAVPGRPPAPRRRRARGAGHATATPAPATPPRCRCAWRSPCARCG